MANTLVIGGKSVVVPTDRSDYWANRANHDLYRFMKSTAAAMFPDAKSAIDVGCYTSGLICEFDWINRRVASDLQNLKAEWADVPNVDFVHGNAFELELCETFDLVISNQTIEHLEKPKEFVDKLLSIGRGLIISTTYETEAGLIDGHIQDPISMEKFLSWFPCELDAYIICEHPTANKRLLHIIAVVKKYHPNRLAA
jgi:2-polyprenyl-3-methyl-5-hydroxy-6-metoxy-1,4-benzoquinol methylase